MNVPEIFLDRVPTLVLNVYMRSLHDDVVVSCVNGHERYANGKYQTMDRSPIQGSNPLVSCLRRLLIQRRYQLVLLMSEFIFHGACVRVRSLSSGHQSWTTCRYAQRSGSISLHHIGRRTRRCSQHGIYISCAVFLRFPLSF